jgi:hypothetical protein
VHKKEENRSPSPTHEKIDDYNPDLKINVNKNVKFP